ncbi:NAD(P)-binding protein [Ramicandelaber brevisporus]|nr:NAD(P)-binding protein [Ramicandelaber brevisporus]
MSDTIATEQQRQQEQSATATATATATSPHTKVFVVTGANSGVGYGVVQRLLALTTTSTAAAIAAATTAISSPANGQPSQLVKPDIIVLACRNASRMNAARDALLAEYPNSSAKLETIILDTSSVDSVKKTAAELIKRFGSINALFCNAGIMPTAGLNWPNIFKGLLTSPIELSISTMAIYQPVGDVTKDGIGSVFATNVFGHYLLISLIDSLLEAATVTGSGPGRVIWTGSISKSAKTASGQFLLSDIEHVTGSYPYESSKYAVDIVSCALNGVKSSGTESPRKARFVSFTTEPGNVTTNILGALNSGILGLIITGLFCIYRIFSRRFTLSGYNAATANVYVATQPLEHLDPMQKYHSEITFGGKNYVVPRLIDNVNEETLAATMSHINGLMDKFATSTATSTSTATTSTTSTDAGNGDSAVETA